MDKTYAIGIDLGTSTSVVSVLDGGKLVSIPDPSTKSPLVPSVVGINKRGELLVGQRALDQVADPTFLVRESKRMMGENHVFEIGEVQLRPEEVAALILKRMKEIAEGFLGTSALSAVITVPAYFTDVERRATQKAADLAGLEVIRIINEPTAAALAFGMNNLDSEENLLVFDMGGGTLDVTILEMIGGVIDVNGSGGDKRLGGSDIDSAIVDLAEAELMATHGIAPVPSAKEQLKRRAEQVKKELSSAVVADLTVTNVGAIDGREIDIDRPVSEGEFNRAIEPIIQRAIKCVESTITKAGKDRNTIDRVLLVGGSTYIPRVRESVLGYLDKPEVKGVDPDLAVSQGAAISAALAKTGAVNKASGAGAPILQDAATYGFGVLVVEEVGNQEMLVYSELMPIGAAIPFVRENVYSLRRPDQTQMEIDVVQTDILGARLPDQTIATGAHGVITDIPIALYGKPHDVKVTLTCDQNHIIQVTAQILGTGKSLSLKIHKTEGLMGESEAAESLVRIDSLWSSSPLAQRHGSIIKRAEQALLQKPSRAEQIEAALIDLKTQVASQNEAGAQLARERLTDLLSEL